MSWRRWLIETTAPTRRLRRQCALDGRDDVVVLRIYRGAEPRNDRAIRANDELLEVPADFAAVSAGVGEVDHFAIERVTVPAIDLDLLSSGR